MKSLITLFAATLLSTASFAQSFSGKIKYSSSTREKYLHIHQHTDNVMVLGCADKFSGKIKDGLLDSRLKQGPNELVLISGYDDLLTYYRIYNEAGKLLAAGKLEKSEGEYAIIKMGAHFPESYCLILSNN